MQNLHQLAEFVRAARPRRTARRGTLGSGCLRHRCADGKRVHRGKAEPQVNVHEDAILEQLAGAIDLITVGEKLAHAVADELSATHREAARAKARMVAGYEAEVQELRTKENGTFDRFYAGAIDREMYDRQVARVRAGLDGRSKFDAAQHAEDDRYLVTAARVLELAKSAKFLWEMASPEQKRDLLERLVSHPRLDGRTVRYDLRKPFDVLARKRGVGGWRPQRDSNPR